MAWMEFEGLSEIIKQAEKIASISEIEKTNKNILKKCGKVVQKESKSKARRSKNPMESGRKGSRTGQHMGDNIPLTGVKKKHGNLYIIVGWEKEDNSPYFYAKFEEWGTSQRPAAPFLNPSVEKHKKEFNKIAEEEYNKLLKDL